MGTTGTSLATEAVTQSIWQQYAKERSPEIRQQLAMTYMHLVKFVVMKYVAALTNAPGTLETKDLEQVGALGLLDAVDRYDPGRGVKFETYAMTRIRGTIQDELRRLDWVPRSVRKSERETYNNAKSESYLTPGVEQRRIHTIETGEVMHTLAGTTDTVEGISTDADPLETTDRNQMKVMITQLINRLPEDDRMIITLYYYEDLTFKEIGLILRLSESRVSQRHSAMMKRLRSHCEGVL